MSKLGALNEGFFVENTTKVEKTSNLSLVPDFYKGDTNPLEELRSQALQNDESLKAAARVAGLNPDCVDPMNYPFVLRY